MPPDSVDVVCMPVACKNHIPSCWQVCLILCSLRLLLRNRTLYCLLDMLPKLLMDSLERTPMVVSPIPWVERQVITLIKFGYTLIILIRPIITPGTHAW